ncbi:hypothetical protein GCM10023107_09420 [Actinoplanes octamycinicus]|nr:hypothetical protein Aoc01nite_10910 [Actinoplanes octamycinicus]
MTHQNPSSEEVAQARQNHDDHGDPGKEPDYLIEGRVFDCYSPNPATSTRNAWSYVEDKVQREQTQRVIIDLKEWRGDLSSIAPQFHNWDIPGLKEVKIVTPDEEIIQILP